MYESYLSQTLIGYTKIQEKRTPEESPKQWTVVKNAKLSSTPPPQHRLKQNSTF